MGMDMQDVLWPRNEEGGDGAPLNELGLSKTPGGGPLFGLDGNL